MHNRQYRIRTATKADLERAVEWAAQEGWNPGLHDADCYQQADPHGFLAGFLGDEMIASISVVRYDDSFGFLGFYIVREAYRDQGYGLQIWKAGLDYLHGCNIGLDGVVAQQENYRQSGFSPAYRNIRYQGAGSGPCPDPAGIVESTTLPFPVIADYDRAFFPAPREAFLKAWLKQPGSHALGLLENGALQGYGVIRPCRTGYKIGPLYANTPDQAEILFQALVSRVKPGTPVFLDTPETNREAVALAENHGMTVSFETARMYTGHQPELPVKRIFGVTSFEIG